MGTFTCQTVGGVAELPKSSRPARRTLKKVMINKRGWNLRVSVAISVLKVPLPHKISRGGCYFRRLSGPRPPRFACTAGRPPGRPTAVRGRRIARGCVGTSNKTSNVDIGYIPYLLALVRVIQANRRPRGFLVRYSGVIPGAPMRVSDCSATSRCGVVHDPVYGYLDGRPGVFWKCIHMSLIGSCLTYALLLAMHDLGSGLYELACGRSGYGIDSGSITQLAGYLSRPIAVSRQSGAGLRVAYRSNKQLS